MIATLKSPSALPVRGFTLTELAIVIVIVALLAGGMMITLSTSRDIANEKETQKLLVTINEALLGFAAANGRLPCPATTTSTVPPSGKEAFCTNASGLCTPELVVVQSHGRCADFFNGFVPAATLGLSPTDSFGFAIDAWGNRIRYAVSNATSNYTFTTPPTASVGMKGVWANDPSLLKPDLRVCSTSTNITNSGTATADCPAADQMTNNAVAVVFSTGKNGNVAPTNANELANWINSSDRVFVSVSTAAGSDFDDIVTWISPNILYSRMIAAGRLP